MNCANLDGSKNMKLALRLASSMLACAVGSPVFAQDADAPSASRAAEQDDSEVEANPDGETSRDEATQDGNEILVTGIRRTIQTSIDEKREATTITDVVSSDQIGDLPALSIGEVLETITGAGANRSRVGATEFALRGLGPFFGASYFNGREATNGSGDRSVNFSQFPSELINTVRVYKSQQASLIEGGISGIVALETLRPLETPRRLVQLEGKLNYNDMQSGYKDGDHPGWRGTASYVDRYDLGSAGELGVSAGVQYSDVNNPVSTYGTSTTWLACNDAVTTAGRCPEVSRAQVASGTPYYLTPSQRLFRQTSTDDTRKSAFGAVQWKPNPSLDINLDLQWSRADFNERRHDLGFIEAIAAIQNRTVSDDGVLLAYDGISTLASTADKFSRGEVYFGGGLNIASQASDRLKLIADVSYSRTRREDLNIQSQLRTDALDIFGNPTAVANQRIPYSFDATGGEVPVITVDPRFDVNDYSLFSDDLILQRRQRIFRNSVVAGRFDGEYELDGPISLLSAGVRLSELRYSDLEAQFRYTQPDRTVDRAVNEQCRIEFPQSNYLASSNTNVISSWATFDPVCQFNQYLGTTEPAITDDLRDTGNKDVRERTFAAYAMASFDTSVGSLPVRGNIGVRYVDTSVESIGLRSDFQVVDNGDGTVRLEETGDFRELTITHDYSAFLPSLNVLAELSPDFYLRGAVYRAFVRADPSDLGAGRDIVVDAGNFTSAQDAISEVIANGNPRLDPLYAWNFDVSAEYYLNQDSLFAAAAYYKIFQGATIPVVQDETFTIDGQDFTVPVTVSQSSDDKSHVFGIELSAQYRFSFLPQPFDGLSGKVSYNYTTTNFETEDIRLGAVYDPVTDTYEDGIVDPVSLDGQSDHVLSTSLIWQIGRFEMQGIYKYRSPYFQKFVGGGRQNRVIRAGNVFDMRASYAISRNVEIKVEALNLTNEPKFADMPIPGSLQAYETYGRSFFAGARVRF